MADKIKALRKEPGKPWERVLVENELHALQHEVGGYIECVGCMDGCVVICDEEGRLKGKPWNGFFSFVGTILAVGTDGDEFCDIPESCAEYIMESERP